MADGVLELLFTVVAVMFLLNLLVFHEERTLGGSGLYGAFFATFAAVAFLTRQSKKKGKEILKKIAVGEYLIMECRAYGVAYNAALMSTAMVWIVDAQGQRCGAGFQVDKGIAWKCEQDRNTELLLIKCGEDFYDFIEKTAENPDRSGNAWG